MSGDPADLVYRVEDSAHSPPRSSQRVLTAVGPLVHLELHRQGGHGIHKPVLRPAADSPEIVRGELLEVIFD